jgi:fructose-bisphosphate aldolase/2-amino-3,7-dideoxy-D-threo-hept-6-ulosonate synthase
LVSGKQVRLARLTKKGRMLCIPLDHALTVGPIFGLENPGTIIQKVVAGGATCILAHKGTIRSLEAPVPVGMILHISASTSIGVSPNRKVLISSARHAIRLGADALSLHINIGGKEESEMLSDLGMVADECDSLDLPLVAMMYPRGENIKDATDPDTVAHVARIGAESGADIVKTVYTGNTETFRQVVRKCPVPVVLAGGSKMDSEEQILEVASSAVRAGAMGVAFGRNVFQYREPEKIVTALRRVVIDDESVAQAMEGLRSEQA